MSDFFFGKVIIWELVNVDGSDIKVGFDLFVILGVVESVVIEEVLCVGVLMDFGVEKGDLFLFVRSICWSD